MYDYRKALIPQPQKQNQSQCDQKFDIVSVPEEKK